MSATYDPGTGLTFNPNREINDARTLVRFFVEPQENAAKSATEGRPIFDDVEMVSITMAADKRTEVIERVKDQHRQRWPELYRAFKEGREQDASGTPLEQWPPMTPARVAELKAVNIRTVEQLAAVSDAGLQQMGLGARQLRDQALAFLQQAKDGSAITALQQKNETLEGQIAVMRKTIEDLQRAVAKKEREGREDA